MRIHTNAETYNELVYLGIHNNLFQFEDFIAPLTEEAENLLELEESLEPIQHILQTHMITIEQGVTPIFQELETILSVESPHMYIELINEFEFGIMPIALALVLALVLNIGPVLSVLRDVPDSEDIVQEVFNNPIVSEHIFDRLAGALPFVIDTHPQNVELIQLLQNFGLASDE